jgi:hypothetical protein
MAITVTYDARQQTNKSLGAALSRGKKAAAAVLNFSGQSNVIASGVVCSFVGFSTIDAVFIGETSGYSCYYDTSLGSIRFPQLASGVSLGDLTSVKCFIWGN